MYANARFGDIVKDEALIIAGGWTPLNLNAFHGHLEIVNTLITAGTDINAKEVDSWTPLHHSAYRGHADIVNALIAAGADINAEDRWGRTPLHHSVYNGNLDIVNAFIAAGADVDANKGKGWTPLFYSGMHGHADIANALISAGADVNAKSRDWTPLHRVAFDGSVDTVKALITAGAEVNSDDGGWSPLHYVAQDGYTDIARLLITVRADVNATVGINGWTPLHVSAQNGHVDISKELIAAGADVKAKADDGWTPLHSLNHGSAEIARANASPHAKVKGRRRVWPRNAGNGHAEIVKVLIAAGADAGEEDSEGMTALHPHIPHTTEVSKALVKYALLYKCGSNWKAELKEGDSELYQFSNECEEQVIKMKDTFLGDTCISVLEYLTETDEKKLALYSSEEKFGINNELGKASYTEKFPFYAEDLEAQFKIGKEGEK